MNAERRDSFRSKLQSAFFWPSSASRRAEPRRRAVTVCRSQRVGGGQAPEVVTDTLSEGDAHRIAKSCLLFVVRSPQTSLFGD